MLRWVVYIIPLRVFCLGYYVAAGWVIFLAAQIARTTSTTPSNTMLNIPSRRTVDQSKVTLCGYSDRPVSVLWPRRGRLTATNCSGIKLRTSDSTWCGRQWRRRRLSRGRQSRLCLAEINNAYIRGPPSTCTWASFRRNARTFSD